MLSYSYSSFPVIKHDKKDSFYPRVIGQKKPAFLTYGFLGRAKNTELRRSVYCKNYATLHSNRIAYSKSSFRKILFCSATPRLAYSCLRFYSFSHKKAPPFLPKRVGKWKFFFNFLIFFIVFIPILSFLVLCLLFCPSPRASPVSAKNFFFAPRLGSKKNAKKPCF